MLRALGGILAAASAAAAAGGCVEEGSAGPLTPGVYVAMTGAALATVGHPGPQDIPFGSALTTFSQRLGDLHADQGEEADASIRAGVLELATILERLPAAAAQPGLRRAASRIRAEVEAAGAHPSVETTKRSLAAVATELLHAARSCYAEHPEVAELARAFASAVSAVDAERSLPDRAAVIVAMIHAERVLATMYAINVR
jgi:hypothetical protein